MTPPPLESVRQAHRELRRSLFGTPFNRAANFCDPRFQFPALEQISDCLRKISQAVQSVSPSSAAGEEWRTELAAYADTLRELRLKLEDFQTYLRIHASRITSARARISAVNAWADLARRIG